VQSLTGWPLGCLLVHLISGVTRLGSALAIHVSCMQLTPGTWPSQDVSFQWLYACVTPERVIYSTRMDSRDLGFSLTDNWYVIWDPPFVVQLWCSSPRCSTSPHCLVVHRYILETNVWPHFGSLAHVPRETLAHAARGTPLTWPLHY